MLKAFGAEWSRRRRGLAAVLLLVALAAFGWFLFFLFSREKFGGRGLVSGLGGETVPMMVGVFFPGLYVGLLFQRRGMSQDVIWGRSRRAVFLTRLFEVYLLSFLACVPFSLANLVILARRWVVVLTRMGRMRMLYCVVMGLLLSLRHIGVGIVLGFALRDFLRLLGVLLGGAAIFVLLSMILSIIGGPEGSAVQGLNMVRDLIFGGLFDAKKCSDIVRLFRTSEAELVTTALGTAGYVLVHSGLAYAFFRRAELK